MSQNQQFQPPGGVLQGMGTLPKQQEQPQQTGSAGLEQLQQQPQQQQQQQQRKAYETVHKPLQSYSPQPDVPQGRHAWTEEETHTLMTLASKHIVTSRGHPHVDWNAVARDMHAQGFDRSAASLMTHYKACAHPSHMGDKSQQYPHKPAQPYSPTSASSAAQGGGGPHKWSDAEECKMMELSQAHIVTSRGHPHIAWDAVARDMHAAGFDRSGNSLSAHFRSCIFHTPESQAPGAGNIA